MLLTIESAGRVLSMFTSESPEHGTTEVALAIGISKSKSHALLMSLTSVGLLRRTGRGRYQVGWRVLSLNRVLAETTGFHRHARPVMRALGGQFGERVLLGALDDGKVVCVDRLQEAAPSGGRAAPPGSHAHAHAGAIGKVLLAYSSPGALEQVISRHGLPALTSRTIIDPDALRNQLAAVRRRGFAVDRDEESDDRSCVAAPISIPGPVVVAAIAIAAPSERFRAREQIYQQAVVRAGRFVSQQLAAAEARSARLAAQSDRLEPIAVSA